MASIQSTLNAINLIVGPREDLAQADAVVCTLDDVTGVITYQWYMIGRPEQSDAGSPASVGPDFLPVDLGVGISASFAVDTDNYGANLFAAGTYLIMLIVNAGTPTETVYRCALSRLNVDGNLTYDPRAAAYASSRIPSFKEISGDGFDSWAQAVERFMFKHTLLMDFRQGTVAINPAGANPIAITWTRNLALTTYSFGITPLIVAPATFFRVTSLVKAQGSVTMGFITDSIAATVDVDWWCILDGTTSS